VLFHTWIFILFFCIVYPVHLLTRRTRLEMPWLLLASYVFYGSWNPLFLPLLIYASIVDYFIVWGMEGSRRKKLWLAAGVSNHIGLLAFFKYSGFVTRNLNALFEKLGLGLAIPDPEGVLVYVNAGAAKLNALLAQVGFPFAIPHQTTLLLVGISFFTFQSMSYIIDVYRGHMPRERNFIRYATYVCFFPQLVAGPIERAGNLLRQLSEKRTIARTDIADGLSLFVVGFFKKVALADYLALYVDKVYGAPGQFSGAALFLATVAFGWQIYFDFAGYTDMARGVARLLGIRLMLNFNNPYLADGLGDFWQRWHISLSTWFKDYVYIPLGGNRGGEWGTYRNMFLTMVISGIWHGAAWTFLIWGALHATGRVCTRAVERTVFYRERIPRLAKQVLVFLFVTFTWIFFRASSVSDAWLIVTRIFTAGWLPPEVFEAGPSWLIGARILTAGSLPLLAVGLVLSLWLYQYIYESKARWLLDRSPIRVGFVLFAIAYMALFTSPGSMTFIYFQF